MNKLYKADLGTFIYIGDEIRRKEEGPTMHEVQESGIKYVTKIENFKKYDINFNFDDWGLLDVNYAINNYKESINYKLGYLIVLPGSTKLHAAKCLCTQLIHYLFPVHNLKDSSIPFAFIGCDCITQFNNNVINNDIKKYQQKKIEEQKIHCLECLFESKEELSKPPKAISEKTYNNQFKIPFHVKCVPPHLRELISKLKRSESNANRLIYLKELKMYITKYQDERIEWKLENRIQPTFDYLEDEIDVLNLKLEEERIEMEKMRIEREKERILLDKQQAKLAEENAKKSERRSILLNWIRKHLEKYDLIKFYNSRIPFGKYKDSKVHKVFKKDISYLKWILSCDHFGLSDYEARSGTELRWSRQQYLFKIKLNQLFRYKKIL